MRFENGQAIDDGNDGKSRGEEKRVLLESQSMDLSTLLRQEIVGRPLTARNISKEDT